VRSPLTLLAIRYDLLRDLSRPLLLGGGDGVLVRLLSDLLLDRDLDLDLERERVLALVRDLDLVLDRLVLDLELLAMLIVKKRKLFTTCYAPTFTPLT
jgi:hypothetical protein